MSIDLLPERIRSKIEIIEPPAHRPDLGSCWDWTASGNKRSGYGQVWWIGFRSDGSGTMALAHRVVYSLLVGDPPPELDHLCRRPSCVRPSHLEDVTHHENLLRSLTNPVAENSRKTHCKNGHAFTPTNTYNWHGSRLCRTCRSMRRRGVEL